MVGAMARRFILGIVLCTAIGALLTVGTAAWAAPVATSVSISGTGLSKPLVIRADSNAQLFTALLGQVDWLRGTGLTSSPEADDLGPKYTVVVLAEEVATQTYDLYPLASGGPRAFRPAKQPDQRKTTAAWFFGRLNMSETLRAAGVPLPQRHDVLSGGIGGGERVIPDDALDASDRVDRLFGDLRRLVLLNGAVVLIIASGLAGIAFLIHHRTR